MPDDTAKVDLLVQAGYDTYNSYPSHTLQFGLEAYDLASDLNYTAGKLISKKVQGIAHWILSDYQASIEAYKEGLSLAQQTKDSIQISAFYINLGVVYSDLGEYYSALAAYLDGLTLSEQIGMKKNVGLCYQNIGAIYSALNEYENAISYYAKAKDIFKEIGYDTGIGVLLNNTGEIFIKLTEYDSALSYFSRSKSIFIAENHKRGISVTGNNLGQVYTLLGQYDKAETELLSALTLKKEIDDKIGITVSKKYLGRLALKLSNHEDAEKYLVEALQLASNIEANEEKIDLLKDLSELYEKTNNQGLALNYFKDFHASYDSLLNSEKNAKLIELQTLYDTEKKEKENLLLKQEKELSAQILAQQKTRSQLYQLLFVISTIGVILFGLLFYQKIKTNARLRTLNRSIRDQKNEIDNQARQLLVANEEINALNDNLENKVNEKTKQILKYSFKNSHEVRAPIARILGLVDFYKQDKNSDGIEDIIDKVEESAQELDSTIHELNSILNDLEGDSLVN